MINLNVIHGRIKSMKLSDYFEIKNPEYEILKLTPTKSNRNTQTDKIAELVNKIYRKTDKLIYKENKKKSKKSKDVSGIAGKKCISLIKDLLNCLLNVSQNSQVRMNP